MHASPAYADGVFFFGSWDSYFYAVDAATGKEKWRFHGGEDPLIHNQVGFQSSPAVADGVVYTGCRDAQLYALDAATGKEKWRFDNALSWVISSPAVADGKVFFATSDSSLYHVVDAATGKAILKQKDKAYMFSSPAIADDVVFIGVLNGTLEARDQHRRGALEFRNRNFEAKQRLGPDQDRRFNGPLLYYSSWREAPIVAADRQFAIGAIFSSPLVVEGVVYFGSTDGYLYALLTRSIGWTPRRGLHFLESNTEISPHPNGERLRVAALDFFQNINPPTAMFFESFFQDLRIGLRMLIKDKTFFCPRDNRARTRHLRRHDAVHHGKRHRPARLLFSASRTAHERRPDRSAGLGSKQQLRQRQHPFFARLRGLARRVRNRSRL